VSTVVGFGEVMARLSPPGRGLLANATTLELTYAGAEANVLAALAGFGEPTRLVTRLPENRLGDGCLALFRGLGVGVDCIVRGGVRLGLYFLEQGAPPRPSRVLYDRVGSALADMKPGTVDWDRALDGADWFHWTGITPAVSESAWRCCREALEAAQARSMTVSCDLNHRASLWQWGRTPAEVMPEMVGECDVLIGNEDAARAMLGASPTGGDLAAACENVARRFPRLRAIAYTRRVEEGPTSVLEGHLLCEDASFRATIAEPAVVVDAIGAGDALAAGLIYHLRRDDGPDRALAFALACWALKQTVPGDVARFSVADVEAVLEGSGRRVLR
jgi:2-dehydro-3-deoxygluconokinase